MAFDLGDYKDVAQRIADFRDKHPEGCLRPANPEEPYRIEAVGGQFFIVYVAAAYRSPTDPTPGIGVAWEPFPGQTTYTKNSELQNAETSAWGRAIVAVLASESKAIASAEDVRNRQADAAASQEEVDELRELVKRAAANLTDEQWGQVQAWSKDKRLPPPERLSLSQAHEALAYIESLTDSSVTGPSAATEEVGPSSSSPTPAAEGGEPDPSGSPTPGAYTQMTEKAKDIADEAPEVTP